MPVDNTDDEEKAVIKERIKTAKTSPSAAVPVVATRSPVDI